MSETPPLAPPLSEVEAASGIAYPNATPYAHITFCLVAWQEERRLAGLLSHLRPFFANIIVGVQTSDDRTRDIAIEHADIVIDDEHHGFGDATFGPKLLPLVTTKWVLKLDADEFPSRELLSSLSNATWYAEQHDHDGVWIPFKSSVEGIEYDEQHSHLRLFRNGLSWPNTLHSRPNAKSMVLWPTGYIRHDRSLDELVSDYLRYYHIGRGNVGWEAHNKMMMRSACEGTASVKGWAYVQAFEWWPEVRALVFQEAQPWLQQSPSSPPVAASPPRKRSAASRSRERTTTT